MRAIKRCVGRIDLLQGGYAAMDNFVVAASDTRGDTGGGTAPEPGVLALVCAGLLGAAWRSPRRKR